MDSYRFGSEYVKCNSCLFLVIVLFFIIEEFYKMYIYIYIYLWRIISCKYHLLIVHFTWIDRPHDLKYIQSMVTSMLINIHDTVHYVEECSIVPVLLRQFLSNVIMIIHFDYHFITLSIWSYELCKVQWNLFITLADIRLILI